VLFHSGWDVKLVKYQMRNQHHDGGGKILLSLTGFGLLYTQPRDSTELEKGSSLEKANASQKCGFLAIDSNNRIHKTCAPSEGRQKNSGPSYGHRDDLTISNNRHSQSHYASRERYRR